MNPDILAEFDRRETSYKKFRALLEPLLQELLTIRNIRIHKLESRTKSRESLAGKLLRPEKEYSDLKEITDICGARIITYLLKDVDQIASLIESEFEIDKEHSIDKRSYAEPDRFGYVSLHYVVALNESRRRLPEYIAFKDYKAEVQIRTIIQHAWAEIEHDLGYKSSQAVPYDIRRRFARLAALLETADEQFAMIDEQVAEYKSKVSEKLKGDDPDIAIDGTSVFELITSDPVIVELEQAISEKSGRPLRPTEPYMCSQTADFLRDAGLTTVAQVHEVIRRNNEKIISVALRRLSKGSGPIGSGISLLYVCYSVLARGADIDKLMRFFHSHAFQATQPLREVATELIESFRD